MFRRAVANTLYLRSQSPKRICSSGPVVIVTQADGKELTKQQGGPAKLAFPPEAGEKYPKEQWMWNIKTIELVGAFN